MNPILINVHVHLSTRTTFETIRQEGKWKCSLLTPQVAESSNPRHLQRDGLCDDKRLTHKSTNHPNLILLNYFLHRFVPSFVYLYLWLRSDRLISFEIIF